jgi:S-adenosylmethionine-diacylgycerolhomoserine-N-methlytransferase
MAKSDPPGNAPVLGMYRLHAPIYDLTRWAFLRGRRTAVDRLSLHAGQSALEVGCGTGGNLARMRRRVGESGEVHGLDLSPHMLAQARRKVNRARWRNVVFHEQEATRFDLGRHFDAILYSYSLSMIPEWQLSLESAARHLTPGGRLVVVDFGGLRGMGPLRRPLLAWLHAHHVHPERPHAEALAALFPHGTVAIQRSAGDWWFVARCVASQETFEVR